MLQFGVVGYNLYLLYYANEYNTLSTVFHLIFAYVKDRTKRLAAEGCYVNFSDNNVRSIAQRSRDGYDVNLVMMDAYLHDGVDFFLLLFPQVKATTHQQLPPRSVNMLNFSFPIDLQYM